MKLNKIFAGLVAASLAATTLSVAAFAEDLEITSADGKVANIQQVGILNGTECTGDVKINSTSWDCSELVNEGFWILGGDNGNAGITLDMLKSYENLEIAYTCDNPLEGAKIGPILKVHLDESKKMADNGGYAFNDYLPAGWVGYGPQGEEGKGLTYNALEKFGSFQIEADGVVTVKTADIIANLETDVGDYLMAVGLGVDNSALGEESEEEVYTIDWKSIKLTGGAAQEETTVAADETTAAADETTVAADETTAAADETTAAADETTAATDKGENTTAGTATDKPNTNTGVEGIAVVAGLAVIATGAIVVAKKRK